jgi:MFS family permease
VLVAGARTLEKSANPLRVLGHRSFRLLWVGSIVSSLGTAIGGVVFTWVVFTTSHSPIYVALLGVVSFLPSVVFGLLAGALVDRVDRRRLMLACDVARLITLGGLAAYTLVFGVNLVALLGAALVVATFSTVFRPATNAAIPRLVPESDFTDSNGLLMAGTTVAGFIGSPIGGILVITVGVVGGLLANALTFGFSGAMIFLMVIPALVAKDVAPKGPRASLLSEFGSPSRGWWRISSSPFSLRSSSSMPRSSCIKAQRGSEFSSRRAQLDGVLGRSFPAGSERNGRQRSGTLGPGQRWVSLSWPLASCKIC